MTDASGHNGEFLKQQEPLARGYTPDERIWAGLAHGSAILFGFGLILAVIVWLTQRKKSAYATFHALQAMAYQVIFLWCWITLLPLMLIAVMFVFIIIMAILAPPRQAEPILLGALPQIVMMGSLLGIFAVYALVALIGAVSCLQGKDFRYPLFGNRLAHYLGFERAADQPFPEEKEDRLVAAISHSVCVLPLYGMFVPVVVWITQQQRSRLLRFQALQAAIYQAVGLVLSIIGTGLNIFLSLVAFVFLGAGASVHQFAVLGMAAFSVFLLLASCVALVFLLGVPLYQLFGFLATIRVLQGRNYRYPILGRMVEARLDRSEAR